MDFISIPQEICAAQDVPARAVIGISVLLFVTEMPLVAAVNAIQAILEIYVAQHGDDPIFCQAYAPLIYGGGP